MPFSNVRSGLYFFDKIFDLSLSKCIMLDNLTILFAVISASNFFTFRIIGIPQVSFYNIHGIKAVKNLEGDDASLVNSALKPPCTRVFFVMLHIFRLFVKNCNLKLPPPEKQSQLCGCMKHTIEVHSMFQLLEFQP